MNVFLRNVGPPVDRRRIAHISDYQLANGEQMYCMFKAFEEVRRPESKIANLTSRLSAKAVGCDLSDPKSAFILAYIAKRTGMGRAPYPF